jgi:hypothetical protein
MKGGKFREDKKTRDRTGKSTVEEQRRAGRGGAEGWNKSQVSGKRI